LSTFVVGKRMNAHQKLLLSSLLILFLKSPSVALSPDSSASCPSTMSTSRTIQRILPRPSQHWVGDAFQVYPVFADLAFSNTLSPMLMFDYAAPKNFPPSSGRPRGVGQHPHRGFETVTIAFQGEVEHHDSNGGTGVIYPGDVQWMTAGRGIIHEEFFSKEFNKRGGVLEMCQLWVNLPKKDKMTKPRYQAIEDKKIPVVDLGHGMTARIIAGELNGVKGPAMTFSPIQLWDISCLTKGTLTLDYPAGHTGIVFMRRGSVEIGDKLVGPQDVALLKTDGSSKIDLNILEKNTSILIMGGEPIDEPIANRGPFVMNTQAELTQAMQDYSSGKMGR